MNFLRTLNIILISVTFVSLSSCGDKEDPIEQENGIKMVFNHTVNDQPLIIREMQYTNAAGNPFEIAEIMYFISDIRLYRNNGEIVVPDQWDDIHYIDTNLPETMEWLIGKDIPAGLYDSISFTFGITSDRNKSFMFVNPPEVNMAWPEVLGGGYHYMMINGFWRDTTGKLKPFDFHLGIGQIYQNNSGQVSDITDFVDNSFRVKPDGPTFTISADSIKTVYLTMNVESWFETPEIFDFNVWGGAIMQNQEAMHIGCINGRDAFSIR